MEGRDILLGIARGTKRGGTRLPAEEDVAIIVEKLGTWPGNVLTMGEISLLFTVRVKEVMTWTRRWMSGLGI